jgi:hypothetical protein
LIKGGANAQSVHLALEDLAKSADVIVMGRIEKISTQPAPDRSNITTQIEVAVIEQWKGKETPSVIINQSGGSAGEITQAVPAKPQFAVGEEAILFLTDINNGLYRVVGSRQGKLLVKTDPHTQQQITQDVIGQTQPLKEFVKSLKSVLR